MSAEEQKALGADAWTAGDYNKAIEHFTNAIDLSVDNDFLKVLYSNRSAAQLKMKQSAAALVDAEKCISIDGNWLKGYTRKGDALYAQLKYSEAYNAYNSGLRVDKNDKTLQEKAERAMNAISASSTPSSGGGGWGSSSGAGSSYTSNAAPTAPGMLGKAQWYLQLLTMGCAFLYLIPFFGRSFSTTCFRVTVGSSLGGRLITLYTKYGVPKFSSEYGSRIAQDPATNTLFLAAILLVSRPYLLPVVAIFLVEFAAVTPYIFTMCRANLPAMEAQLRPMLAKYAPQMANQDLSRVFSNQTLNTMDFQMKRMGALAEVMQGVFLLVELLLPSRNIMFAFMWWQFLQMRYMLDQAGHVKAAFTTLDQKITPLVNHQMCPKLVGTGYGYAKQFLSKQVQMPTEGSSPGGVAGGLASAMSKCTIM